MPWVDTNGKPQKYACEPCIRGHRATKCDHKDRIMIQVRKPGRPLAECPHPPDADCSCDTPEIALLRPRPRRKGTSTNSGRVSKGKRRRDSQAEPNPSVEPNHVSDPHSPELQKEQSECLCPCSCSSTPQMPTPLLEQNQTYVPDPIFQMATHRTYMNAPEGFPPSGYTGWNQSAFHAPFGGGTLDPRTTMYPLNALYPMDGVFITEQYNQAMSTVFYPTYLPPTSQIQFPCNQPTSSQPPDE